jgi:site-specific recombinase XerC
VAWGEERGIGKPVEVTRGTLERYQKWLYAYRQPKSDKPLSLTSQHKRVYVVLELFRWLSRANRILVNPGADIELPKVEKRLPDVLTVAESDGADRGAGDRVDREVPRRGAAVAGREPGGAGALCDDVWGALQ